MTYNDSLAVKLFGRTAAEARHDGICIRCGLAFDPTRYTVEDQREYRITALCPSCWDAVTVDPDEEAEAAFLKPIR